MRIQYPEDHSNWTPSRLQTPSLTPSKLQNLTSTTLFLWPSDKSDTSSEKPTNKGFNIVHWNEGHMTYWAISDLNTVELNEFARDLKARSL
jgi:anti-sigma factor RsiW